MLIFQSPSSFLPTADSSLVTPGTETDFRNICLQNHVTDFSETAIEIPPMILGKKSD